MKHLRIQVIAELERRIIEFIESRGGGHQKPLSLLSHDINPIKLEIIMMNRLVIAHILSERHLGDDGHDCRTCGICGGAYSEINYKWIGMIQAFLETNRELLAELELTK